jgi:hypothetical protein
MLKLNAWQYFLHIGVSFVGGGDVSCDCVGGEHEIEEAED